MPKPSGARRAVVEQAMRRTSRAPAHSARAEPRARRRDAPQQRDHGPQDRAARRSRGSAGWWRCGGRRSSWRTSGRSAVGPVRRAAPGVACHGCPCSGLGRRSSTAVDSQSTEMPASRCSASAYLRAGALDHFGRHASGRARSCPSPAFPGSRARTACRSSAGWCRPRSRRPARSARNPASASRPSRAAAVVVEAELELGVGDEDAALRRVVARERVDRAASRRAPVRRVRRRSVRTTVSKSMFSSWSPTAALVEGVKIGSGSCSAWRRPSGRAMPRRSPVRW